MMMHPDQPHDEWSAKLYAYFFLGMLVVLFCVASYAYDMGWKDAYNTIHCKLPAVDEDPPCATGACLP